MKNFLSRYSVFILGIYLLSAGIVLILRSTLGTTPISSVNYVLSINSPLSLGASTFLFNSLLVAGQFLLVRGCRTRRDTVEILLQLPFSFLFGIFIDLNMALTAGVVPGSYPACLAVLAVGCLVQAAGVVLEVKPQVVKMSAEGFVFYAARRYGRDFGRTKVAFDVALVILAAALSLLLAHRVAGIREGTVAAACITGYLVSFLGHRIFTRRMLHRLFPFVRKPLE